MEQIQRLIDVLPRFAEEGGSFSTIAKCDLLAVLRQQESMSDAEAVVVVELLESLLKRFSLFDPEQLERGCWRFVSYPAQLMAMSILSAWGDEHSPLLEQRFWDTTDSGKIDRQRQLLEAVERNRQRYHQKQQAEVIRHIQVAWMMIRFGDRFLCYRREDMRRTSTPNFGLVGGRTNIEDMERCFPEETSDTLLRWLQSADAGHRQMALTETLHREVMEEIQLEDSVYQSRKVLDLMPYAKVGGGKSNRALSQWQITLFTMQLDSIQYIADLMHRVEVSDELRWFTLDEVVNGESRSGEERLYLDALYQHFNSDSDSIRNFLRDLPILSQQQYQLELQAAPGSAKHGKGAAGGDPQASLILPVTLDEPFLLGRPESLREVVVKGLKQKHLSLLLGLALHLRGENLTGVPVYLTKVLSGWFEVSVSGDDEGKGLLGTVRELVDLLSDTALDGLVEVREERFVRMSINPSSAYFSKTLYSGAYSIEQSEGTQMLKQLKVRRNPIDTILGRVDMDEAVYPVSRRGRMVDKRILEMIQGEGILGELGTKEIARLEGRSGDSRHGIDLDRLGLQKLIRVVGGSARFSIPIEECID